MFKEKLIFESNEACWYENWVTQKTEKHLKKIKCKAFLVKFKKNDDQVYVIMDKNGVFAEVYTAEGLWCKAEVLAWAHKDEKY